MPIKKTIYVLDNELRLRPMTNNDYSNSNSSTSITSIGRFDELTNFFNIINGLFYQSAFTLGLSTYHLAPLFRLPELNIGVTMSIDQQSFEQNQIDLFKNMTLYSMIGRNERSTWTNDDHRQSKLMGIIKLHTSDQNLMLGLNYRWSPSLMTAWRFGTAPQNRLWSRVEYQRPKETYELVIECGTQHSSTLQFSCLSCLWKRENYQIDGGLDLRITSREKLADIGLRLRRSSDSIIFKFDLYHPIEHYLIGFQRYITNNLIVGVLAEKHAGHHHQQKPIKFSLMSEWNLNETGLRINTLVNTENQFGLAFIHQLRPFPVVLQTFALYSWNTHRYKWGVGFQILL